MKFWDDLYAARPAPTDPRPNVRLTEIVPAFEPGDALDIGCGSGGDALWLTRQGWKVTATDISTVAVDRLNQLGLTAEAHDLGQSFPSGTFDLVNAHYFHSPFELDRSAILRTAAMALNPGGHLLVVDHASVAPWSWKHEEEPYFPTPTEVFESLSLQGFEVLRAEAANRIADGPDGQTAEVTDHILLIGRLA